MHNSGSLIFFFQKSWFFSSLFLFCFAFLNEIQLQNCMLTVDCVVWMRSMWECEPNVKIFKLTSIATRKKVKTLILISFKSVMFIHIFVFAISLIHCIFHFDIIFQVHFCWMSIFLVIINFWFWCNALAFIWFVCR